MKGILISIDSVFCGDIFDTQQKKVELRKTKPKGVVLGDRLALPEGVRCYVYESGKNGCRAVIGCFEVWYADRVPEWQYARLSEVACVSQERIRQYAPECVYAWVIHSPRKYLFPRPLMVIDRKHPPESWCYLTDGECAAIETGRLQVIGGQIAEVPEKEMSNE